MSNINIGYLLNYMSVKIYLNFFLRLILYIKNSKNTKMGICGKKAHIMIILIKTNLYGNPQIIYVHILFLNELLIINYFLIYIIKNVNVLFLHTI